MYLEVNWGLTSVFISIPTARSSNIKYSRNVLWRQRLVPLTVSSGKHSKCAFQYIYKVNEEQWRKLAGVRRLHDPFQVPLATFGPTCSMHTADLLCTTDTVSVVYCTVHRDLWPADGPGCSKSKRLTELQVTEFCSMTIASLPIGVFVVVWYGQKSLAQ